MYPNWSIAQLGTVGVPESLRAPEVSSGLADVYDRLSREPLRPWAHADADPARRQIDDAVADVYGLSAAVVAGWRERLAEEPTVANRSPL